MNPLYQSIVSAFERPLREQPGKTHRALANCLIRRGRPVHKPHHRTTNRTMSDKAGVLATFLGMGQAVPEDCIRSFYNHRPAFAQVVLRCEDSEQPAPAVRVDIDEAWRNGPPAGVDPLTPSAPLKCPMAAIVSPRRSSRAMRMPLLQASAAGTRLAPPFGGLSSFCSARASFRYGKSSQRGKASQTPSRHDE